MAAQRRRIIALLCTAPGADLAGLAEACLRFTPQIAVRRGEVIFLDVSKSLQLFESKRLLRWLEILSARFQRPVRLGEACNSGLALARARWGARPLPLTALADLADPFALHAERTDDVARLLHRLRQLGCTRVGDLQHFNLRSLGTRFGKLASILLDTLKGLEVHDWPRLEFPERLEERLDLSERACTDLEPLLFALRTALSRLVPRLRAREKRVARLRLHLSLDDQSTRHLPVEFPTPQSTVAGILQILREKLSREFQHRPLSAAVEHVQILILESAPGRSAQRDFFQKRLEETESLEHLVGRLQQKLGARRIYKPALTDAHRPETAWRPHPALQAVEETPLPLLPPRPTRLLEQPLLLQRQGDDLKEVHGPRHWRVLRWEGPERLSGEWWHSENLRAFARDYYVALTQSGEKLWLFLTPTGHGERLYLHGYFD